MNILSLKPILPKSLFGRVMLILVLPIMLLQLVVGFVFIQKHIDNVTEQMANSLAQELTYIFDQGQSSPNPLRTMQAIGTPLGIDINKNITPPIPTENKRNFDDFSSKTIFKVLAEKVSHPLVIDLTHNKIVDVYTNISGMPVIAKLQRDKISAANPHQLLVLMLFASILLTFIALVFMRNQVRPIKRLATAAEAFGRGRSVPFRPQGAEEVRRAGKAFIAMRARIERYLEQRTLMLSGVGHDLKTPLTRMKLSLSLMDDPEIEALNNDIDQMERMLEGFLNFSRGDATEPYKLTDIFQLCHDIATDFQRNTSNLTFTNDNTPSENRSIHCRPLAIRRAIENLLSNAINYGKHVSFSVQTVSKFIIINIEDDGPGIPENLRETAFKPFGRLDAARSQNNSGHVGLGLSIALDVARSHGGHLFLDESETLEGLKATLRLPI